MSATLLMLGLLFAQPAVLSERLATWARHDFLGGEWAAAEQRLDLASRLQSRQPDLTLARWAIAAAVAWQHRSPARHRFVPKPLLPEAKDKDGLVARAELRLDRGDLAGALTDINTVLATDDTLATAWILRADCYYRREEFGSALANLQRAQTLEASLPRLYLLRGLCFQKLDRTDDCDAAFEDARRLRVFQWEISYYYALLDFERGRFDDSASWLSRCLRRNPNHKRARYLRALLREQAANYREMRDDLDVVLQIDPGWTEALRLRILANEALNDPAAVEGDLSKLLQLEPNNAAAYAHLAQLRATTGTTAEAIALASRAVALRPAKHEYLLLRANLVLRSRWQLILTHWTPGPPPLQLLLSEEQTLLGLIRPDVEELRQCAPQDAQTWHVAARYHLLMGQFGAAKEAYHRWQQCCLEASWLPNGSVARPVISPF